MGVSLRVGWCGASLGEGNASQKHRRPVERRDEGDGRGGEQAARASESTLGRTYVTAVQQCCCTIVCSFPATNIVYGVYCTARAFEGNNAK